MVADLLAPERAIIERLKEEVPGVDVRAGADAATVLQKEAPQRTTLFVLFGGSTVRAPATSSVSIMDLNWIVVVAVRNVADTRAGSAAREEAGPLCSQVIGALQEWKPCDGFDDLKLTGADAPVSLTGYFIYPIVFTTNTAF